jgi:hypothetical protein
MVEFVMKKFKDLGQKREVTEALPYAVVGGTWQGSISNPMLLSTNFMDLLNHVVPHGKQLKMLFLRVTTENAGGALFSIVQTNPTGLGQTGLVEGYPVVGSVPQGVRDWPFLEAAGAEVLSGNLSQPIHVLEGSIDFLLYGPLAAQAARYSLSWWGVEEDSE